LTKSAAETFNNKVSLIYEFNKKSPLFIRKADEEIKNNQIERAVEILLAGLKVYPDYAAAHFILGRAYSLLGQFNFALKSIKTGSVLINSAQTYDYYLKEIDSARKQRSLFDSTSRISFFSSDIESVQPIIIPEVTKEKEIKLPEVIENQIEDIDDRLEEIARNISHSKLSESPSSLSYDMSNIDNFIAQDMFVSETLAKIYITQGEFKEAIEVYQKLINKTPSKQEYYLQRISELQSQLE
jgi:tetratricopeptide (TPR) repeat protein